MFGRKSILILSALILVVQGFPNYDYSSDYSGDDDYYGDNELVANEEEEKEIQYDINFLNIGGALVVDKGTTIKLPCQIDKYPENFVVIWKKVEPGKNAEDILAMGSTVLKNDNRFSVEINREGEKKGSTLVIALAEDADKGHYLCQLGSNDKKKELKHTVTVRDPPSIAKTPSNGLQKAHKGDDVTLSCIGSGNPEPVITWTRLNKKLPDGREKLEATELSFLNVDKRHAGTYVCTANNGFGTEVKEKIHLDVECPRS